jgi:hypothetical protein
MKLRNKKTGKVLDLECITVFDRPGKNDIGDSIDEFYTIAELNEEWEDYKPAEPLIKDEKVRKAVRAWAEVNKFEPNYTVKYNMNNYGFTSWQADIEFNFHIKDLEDDKEYTIAELCGEEEE